MRSETIILILSFLIEVISKKNLKIKENHHVNINIFIKLELET